MELTVDQSIVADQSSVFTADTVPGTTPAGSAGAGELAFELGAWLSGLESFLRIGGHAYGAVQHHEKNAPRDFIREMRLTHAALMLCSRLAFRLRRASSAPEPEDVVLTAAELSALAAMLRQSILINEGLIKSGALGFGEWNAWKDSMSEKIAASPEAAVLIDFAEKSCETYLPEKMTDLLANEALTFAETAELRMILPRFARILKWLSIVGRMLANDEPLKLTLLIFARVHEQTAELISHIDNRLARFPDETAELFGSLDGASYTASLEVKKVYTQELVGLVGVRPAPSVYARIETAYALLNDSFEQILGGFARLMDPGAATLDLFPSFRAKLDNSLKLRRHLARVRASVATAERTPEKPILDELKKELNSLLADTMRFLFYKDRETIERFSEEIFAAGDKKDLVPILHRFGAYLETLFGQVNMRTVLADHPFVDARE